MNQAPSCLPIYLESTDAKVKLLSAALMALLISTQLVAADSKQVEVVQHFTNLPAGYLAEGLAIGEGHFYAGTINFGATDGTILEFNQTGDVSRNFTVPGFPIVGEVELYHNALFAVACTAFSPTAPGTIVRVNLVTGNVSTVASDPTCPNGLAIDRQGNMFVTNIFNGTISKVTPSGTISIFASGPLLATGLLDGFGLVGPNDLTFNKGERALYVTNVGQNTVVKVEIQSDGTAGAITKVADVPTPDGLAFDQKGNLYVTSPFTNTIWLVAPDGTTQQVPLDTTQESLDAPSNLAFRGNKLYITNLAITTGASKISVTMVQYPGIPL